MSTIRKTVEIRTFYAASVHHVAKTRTPDADDFDDLVQEGVIAAWQATQAERDDPATYGAVTARRRITGMLTGRYPMTGSERTDGTRSYDLARQHDRRESFALVEDLLDHGNPFVAVEQRVDMERAMRGMDPRDRTIARLVSIDQPWDKIGPAVGLAPVSARNRWDRTVRPALRDLLAVA